MDHINNAVNLAYLVMSIAVIVATAFNTYITLNMKLEVASLKLEVERLMATHCRKAEDDDKAVCEWVESYFLRTEIARTEFKNIEDRVNRCRFCSGKAEA